MPTSNGTKRITLAVLDAKLSDLIQLVTEHATEDRRQFERVWTILQGEADAPGLKGKLDRLEQTEARRAWHVRALWGAFFAAAFVRLLEWVRWG